MLQQTYRKAFRKMAFGSGIQGGDSYGFFFLELPVWLPPPRIGALSHKNFILDGLQRTTICTGMWLKQFCFVLFFDLRFVMEKQRLRFQLPFWNFLLREKSEIKLPYKGKM